MDSEMYWEDEDGNNKMDVVDKRINLRMLERKRKSIHEDKQKDNESETKKTQLLSLQMKIYCQI